MGNINVEIPESIHQNLRHARVDEEKTIEELVVESLEKDYGGTDEEGREKQAQ